MVGLLPRLPEQRAELMASHKSKRPDLFRRHWPYDLRADARGAPAAGLPLLRAGVTAPAGITEAPASCSRAVTEAISSSQLWAKDAMPCASKVLATSAISTPIRHNPFRTERAAA
jgi:hypothetical protein